MTDNEPDSRQPDSGGLAMEITSLQPRLYGFILKRLADRELTLEVLQRTNLVQSSCTRKLRNSAEAY
jgi:RNA polymerase sigma-70 factor (ECF subfamily)